jgi:hypothetical protein
MVNIDRYQTLSKVVVFFNSLRCYPVSVIQLHQVLHDQKVLYQSAPTKCSSSVLL